MTHKEYEIKLMLSKSQYEQLLDLFNHKEQKTYIQTNYYYDTQKLEMKKNRTTVRIREKNGTFTLTVKNHHFDHSIENSFKTDSAPRIISINNMNLKLFGKLRTKRTQIEICKGIKLMLDHNEYLGTEDYELELEYSPHQKEQANSIIHILQDTIGCKNRFAIQRSKSERFFINLFQSDRNCAF